MRFVDFSLAFPSLFAILIFSAIFEAGPVQLIAIIGLTGWMTVARLIRGEVRGILNQPFVEAAHTLGAGNMRVVFRHILPNTGGILFVAALAQFSRSIIAEATVSFLGFGVQPPTPTWGNLLIGAQDYVYIAPWLAIAPGIAISLTLLAVYSLGMGASISPRAGLR